MTITVEIDITGKRLIPVMQEIEARVLKLYIEAARGSKKEAANQAGISYRSLMYRQKALGLSGEK
jgi:transcriptional regulator with PAS, ATPase and Fis domain